MGGFQQHNRLECIGAPVEWADSSNTIGWNGAPVEWADSSNTIGWKDVLRRMGGFHLPNTIGCRGTCARERSSSLQQQAKVINTIGWRK